MSKQPKTSYKLPIILMVSPTLGIVLGIFLYAVMNFILAGYVPESSSSSISQGASSEELFAEDDGTGLFRTVSNILLFLLGAISVLAFLPCLIFGIILFVKRRNAREDIEALPVTSEKRNWEDLQ